MKVMVSQLIMIILISFFKTCLYIQKKRMIFKKKFRKVSIIKWNGRIQKKKLKEGSNISSCVYLTGLSGG